VIARFIMGSKDCMAPRQGGHVERRTRQSPRADNQETDMNIQRYDTNSRMSQAVVHNGFAFLAGQVAADAPGASVTEQTKDVLKHIDALLAKVGSDRNSILSATIWISDMSKFQEMNAVWDAWIPAGQAPARATTEANLAAPEFTVEIAVIAAVKG
jgi:enamine deaminase RidA (YjgF/YER057c/UK114 family)